MRLARRCNAVSCVSPIGASSGIRTLIRSWRPVEHGHRARLVGRAQVHRGLAPGRSRAGALAADAGAPSVARSASARAARRRPVSRFSPVDLDDLAGPRVIGGRAEQAGQRDRRAESRGPRRAPTRRGSRPRRADPSARRTARRRSTFARGAARTPSRIAAIISSRVSSSPAGALRERALERDRGRQPVGEVRRAIDPAGDRLVVDPARGADQRAEHDRGRPRRPAARSRSTGATRSSAHGEDRSPARPRRRGWSRWWRLRAPTGSGSGTALCRSGAGSPTYQ